MADRPVVVAVGNLVSMVADDLGDELEVPVPFHQPNDIIVIHCEYYPSPNIPDAPPPPPGFAASTALTYSGEDRVITTQSAHIWWWKREAGETTENPKIVRPNATATSDPDTHLSASAFIVRNCTLFGDPFQSRANDGDYSGAAGIVDIPAVTSTHAGATAIAIVGATHSNVVGVTSPASGYTVASAKYAYTGAGAASVIITRPIDIETLPAASSGFSMNDPGAAFNSGTVFVFVAIPQTTLGPTTPSTSVPIRGSAPASKFPARLGCADSYEAIITAADYETRIDAVRYSKLEWDRALDDISGAKVVVPDEFGGVACVAKYGGLKPWRYGMTIERNGQPVWKGPVTSLSRSAGAITISCKDAMIRFKRRLATRGASLQYVAADAGRMYAEILNVHARVATDAWAFKVPTVDTGVALTRNVVAREFNYAWDVAEDLLDSAIDAYVLAGTPVVFQPGIGWVIVGPLDEQYSLNTDQASAVSVGGDTLYGLFTQDAVVGIPDWSIDGMAQANTSWLAGADSGEAGFRRYWTAQVESDLPFDSVLDIVETAQLYRAGDEEQAIDESVFQRRADSIVALRAIAPAVIDAAVLTPAAPINIENLRPGTIWLMDIYDDGWGQLLGAGRVKRVSVTYDPSEGEVVSVTLQPPGYTEEDL